VSDVRYLLEHEAQAKLASYGIEIPRQGLATSATAAAERAEAIGCPVVLKVVSPDVPHKTEAGGVRLGVRSPEAAAEAYAEILASVRAHQPTARIEGVLVAEQVEVEQELFCGVVRDPQFGPVVAFGLGGIFVEVLQDVAFGVTPLELVDALEMIRSIRGHAVIAGARGRRPVDQDKLAGVLLAAARLAVEHEDLEELDINPLAATSDGRLVALDCLIRLRSS